MEQERNTNDSEPPTPTRIRAAPVIARAPLPIVEVQGREHTVICVNAAFCKLLGMEKESLIGKTFAEIIPHGGTCVGLLDTVYQTDEAVTHSQPIDSEDTPSTWLFAMWPALDANDVPVGALIQMTKAVVSRQSITEINEALLLAGLRQHELAEAAQKLNEKLLTEIAERERAQEAQRESEGRLRFMAESLPGKIFTATPEGEVDYYNQRWMEYTGLSLEEIKGWGWTRFIHPDDLEENHRLWSHSLATGEPFRIEHRFQAADGAYRWHLSRALAMRGEDGEIDLWVGSSTDIDEQKQTMQRLADADRHKDEYLAMLAHELRNPLAPIKNAALVLRLVHSDNPTIVRSQEIIERQVDHLAKLVDDLLDLSRIQSGKVTIRKVPMDLTRAITEAVDSCRPMIKAHDHTVTLGIEAAPPLHIDADPTRVDQILLNLIGNAVKYTPSQGHISVEASRENGEAVIRVRDDGIGLAPHMLESVFEVFTQVEQSLDRTKGGLGLGLNLVRELVQLHGGTVEAKSRGLDQGSEFVVRLPALARPDERLLAAVEEPEVQGAAKRILVVDDDPDNRETMEMCLSMFGHRIELAEDGEEAIEKALKSHPDVAFIDIGLPKLNGYEVAQTIRKRPGGESIVLIALSGYGRAEDKARALEAGFDAHLTKPVNLETLTKILKQLEQFGRDAGKQPSL